MTSCCELGNESTGFIKFGEFLYWLRNFWFLKKKNMLNISIARVQYTVRVLYWKLRQG